MAVRIPDKVILDAISRGFDLIISDPTRWIPIVLGGRTQREQESLSEFLRRGVQSDDPDDAAKYGIKKFLGYPSSVKELPCLAVTISTESETTRGIGDVFEDVTENMHTDPNRNWTAHGSLFEGSFSIDCYSLNPNLTAYLQAIVKFILLYYRGSLHEDYGLLNQRLTCSDLRVDAESIPELAFVRQVQLSCVWANTWHETVNSLEAVDVDPTWVDATLVD